MRWIRTTFEVYASIVRQEVIVWPYWKAAHTNCNGVNPLDVLGHIRGDICWVDCGDPDVVFLQFLDDHRTELVAVLLGTKIARLLTGQTQDIFINASTAGLHHCACTSLHATQPPRVSYCLFGVLLLKGDKEIPRRSSCSIQ